MAAVMAAAVLSVAEAMLSMMVVVPGVGRSGGSGSNGCPVAMAAARRA
jgi:hypothetical protein